PSSAGFRARRYSPPLPAWRVERVRRALRERTPGNRRDFSAGGDENPKGDPVRDGEPAAFDQCQRFVHLGALGPGLGLGDLADREAGASPLEGERAVVAVSFLRL